MSIEGTVNTEYASLSGKIRTFVVDKSLSISGACADAKATGEKIDNIIFDATELCVKKTGDTMTGDLAVEKNFPKFLLKNTGNNRVLEANMGGDAIVSLYNKNSNGGYTSLHLQAETVGVKSALRFTHKVDKDTNAVGYDVLHTGNLEALGSARVASGTVTGSNTASEESPNSITFPFAPKLVIIKEINGSLNHNTDLWANFIIWTPSVTSEKVADPSGGSYVGFYRRFKLEGTKLSWWVDQNDTNTNPAAIVGDYIAFG